MKYNELTLVEKERLFFSKSTKVKRGEAAFNICADYLKGNSLHFAECERELYVSLFPMLPLLDKTVSLEDADYILYSHPYARVEDMSPYVLKQLHYIDEHRRPGAEIIVVGKSSNAEQLLAGSIEHIVFWPNHYAELVGKKFGLEIKDEYFVYNSQQKALNIWPVNGCLRQCKFCRRTYMNIPFESLSLDYIREKLDWYKNYHPEQLKNILLRAENLTEYGVDLYGRQALADLIDLISSYDEVKAIGIVIGLAICELTDEILEAMCRSGKFVDIAMSLEAGSNRLLQTIGKEHTRERAIHITHKLKEVYPTLYLRSTVMVGLPTETLSDIYELADLCVQTQMNSIQVNMYEVAPKYPLNELPQLSPQLREYHLRLMVKLLKRNKIASTDHDTLIIGYQRKTKRGSLQAERRWLRDEYRFRELSVLTWRFKREVFLPEEQRFVKYDATMKPYVLKCRAEYLRPKLNHS